MRFSFLVSRFSLTRGTLAALALLGLTTLAPSAQAQTFSLDDGTSNIQFIVGSPFMWGNHFNTSSAITLTTIQVAFGGGNGNGVTLSLFSDPTNNGNPNDAVLLTSTTGTVSGAGTNTFINYAITPTALASGAHFYVTATSSNGLADAALDTSSNSPDSLIAFGTNWTTAFPVSTFIPGRWMVRAVATSSAVAPEPGTLAFLALGGTLVLVKRRRLQ